MIFEVTMFYIYANFFDTEADVPKGAYTSCLYMTFIRIVCICLLYGIVQI